MVAPLGALVAAGLWHPWTSSDTPGYLDAAVSPTPLGEMRLPLYGWFAGPLIGTGLIPWLQTLAFVGAGLWLARAVMRAGASRTAAIALGLTLAWSNLLLLWGNAILPELPAHAALIAALAATVELSAGASAWTRIPLAAGLSMLAWALLPSLLPFIVMLPALALALRPPVPRLRAVGRAAMLGAACLAPFLGLSALRWQHYGDFNVVSFGGFQMAGMAALMLEPANIARLPPALQPDATRIVTRRSELQAAGQAIAVPPNSTGQRSFLSEAIFYFDILARTHDPVLWYDVIQLRRPGESWPAFNARMQRLALATIVAAPADYLAWIIGATSRLVGHALVLNAVFLAGVTSLLATLTYRRPSLRIPPRDIHILLALTIAYTIGTSGLIVLATFPASRYIDSAALLLAVWPLYGALLRIMPPCRGGAP